MNRFSDFFTNNTVRKYISVIALFCFCVSGYFIFISDNYNLFWSYLVFAFSTHLFFSVTGEAVQVKKVPWKKKLLKSGTWLLIIQLLLFSISYYIYHSRIYVKEGRYEFGVEEPYFRVHNLGTSPWYNDIFRSEDFSTRYQRISSLPTENIPQEFGETLLRDLGQIEGNSLGFVRTLNYIRLLLKEGTPIEVGIYYAKGIDSSNEGIAVVKIVLFPNDKAYIYLSENFTRARLFNFQMSEESIAHFREMFE